MDEKNTAVKLPMWRKIGYGLGESASGMSFVMISNYLTMYYSDVVGLSTTVISDTQNNFARDDDFVAAVPEKKIVRHIFADMSAKERFDLVFTSAVGVGHPSDLLSAKYQQQLLRLKDLINIRWDNGIYHTDNIRDGKGHSLVTVDIEPLNFLAQRIDGRRYHTISPFCKAAVEKDANAFSHLMAHIRETDPDHTVIVMQVENEIELHGGCPGTERDYSEIGDKYYNSEVPAVLQEKPGVSGTWEEAFGDDAAESLMAWAFADAVERIASAGKKELNLPCYCNAWLEQPPYRAGYGHPSGGPITRVQPVWRATAPSIFGYGPDIYVGYAPEVMERYQKGGNPLFIPEIRKDAVTATYALYAVAGCNALCYSPFGIEDVNMKMEEIEGVPMPVLMSLGVDTSALDIVGTAPALAESYRILSNLWPLILEKRGTRQLQAFIYRHDDRKQHICKFSKYDIQINYSGREMHMPDSGGFIIELSDDEFLLVGTRYMVQFLPKIGKNVNIDIELFQEGDWANGKWNPGRILNGDEKMMPRVNEQPTIRYIKLFEY